MIVDNVKTTTFNLFPLFQISRSENTLTKEAKNSFDIHWDHYYTVEIGWLFWKIVIKNG